MTKLLNAQQKMEFTEIKRKFPSVTNVFYTLIAIDISFVLLHAFSLSLPLTESTKNLRLDFDFGYAEMFQYLKFIGVAIMLALLFFKKKLGVYIVWGLFFLFLFADDAFSFHEKIGGIFAKSFNLQGVMGLRGQDLGELAFVGVIALFFMFFFIYFLWKGTTKEKEITKHFFLLMGILVFFGVGIDMLHSVLVQIPGSGILTVVEDWGEMLAGSLIVCYSLYLFLKQNIIKK